MKTAGGVLDGTLPESVMVIENVIGIGNEIVTEIAKGTGMWIKIVLIGELIRDEMKGTMMTE